MNKMVTKSLSIMNTFRKLLCLTLLMLVVGMAEAVPVKPGLWREIKLTDGTTVFVQLRGDEHLHYYADRDGNIYSEVEDGIYSLTTLEALQAGPANDLAQNMRKLIKQVSHARRVPRKSQGIPTDKSKFRGKKKGLVILAQYTDTKFSTTTPGQFGCTSTQALYDKIINTRHLDMEPFYGSVKDYFIDQSDGLFELDFDVVGPVTLSKPRAFYGGGLYYATRRTGTKQTLSADDILSGLMIYEAINLAKDTKKADGSSVNFSDYDWDKDGEAEVVYVVYAGQGEADGGDAWTVWPHKSDLNGQASTITQVRNIMSQYSSYYFYYKKGSGTTSTNYTQVTLSEITAITSPTYNNTNINTYACSNELATNQTYNSSTGKYTTNGTQLSGIGTICHEFSHTMGYPDMYDVDYKCEGIQMGEWDLMNSGSYNGSWNGGNSNWATIDAGYRPCGYTAFERWCAGWLEPKELTEPTKISWLKPIGGTASGGASDHGGAYVVYMPGSPKTIEGEYYLLENRQWANWDAAVPWFGLLVSYVHYNEALWESNCLNCTNAETCANRGVATNTHPRMTRFQASGYDPGLLLMDSYPYYVGYLPQIVGSSFGTTGPEIAANINSQYSSYSVALNTANNTALTNTTSPSAYYWGNATSAQTLTNQEIWNIETNSDDDRTVTFQYRIPAATATTSLDQNSTEPVELTPGMYTQVSINKPLTSGVYNSLWVPFDLNRYDVQAYFGANAAVFRFSGVTTDGEGNSELNFTEDTANGIKAFEPVLVRIGDDDATIAEIGNIPYVRLPDDAATREPVVEKDGWKMVGTKSYDFVPAGAYYVSNNLYYRASGTKAKLRAFRAYFQAPEGSEVSIRALSNRYVEPQSRPVQPWGEISMIDMDNPASLFFDISKFTATGIGQQISIKPAEASTQLIYDMNGRCLGKRELSSLPQGVYIVGGKKVIR